MTAKKTEHVKTERLEQPVQDDEGVEELAMELDTLHYPGDWPEDFDQENGNYFCLCPDCKQIFRGHRRRVTCKQCAGGTIDSTGTIDSNGLNRT